MKRSFIIALSAALTLCAFPAHGRQDSAHAAARSVTIGSQLIGGGFLGNTGALNKDLEALGFSGLKDYSYSMGFAFVKARGRMIHSLEFSGVKWRSAENALSVTELYGTSALLTLGFNVLNPEGSFRLYPYAGAGMGMQTLRLRDAEVTLGDALAQPIGDVRLTRSHPAFTVGAGFDAQLSNRRKPSRSHLLGVRAGYRFDASQEARWRVGETLVSDGPDFSMSGWYGQLVIGRTRSRPEKRPHGRCPMAAGKGCGRRAPVDGE